MTSQQSILNEGLGTSNLISARTPVSILNREVDYSLHRRTMTRRQLSPERDTQDESVYQELDNNRHSDDDHQLNFRWDCCIKNYPITRPLIWSFSPSPLFS